MMMRRVHILLVASVLRLMAVAQTPVFSPAPFDAAAVEREDAERAANGDLMLYGRLLPIHLGLSDAACWKTLDNGDRLWRARIVSPGAKGIELFYAEMRMPEGAELNVLDASEMPVYGPYSAKDIGPDGTFTTPLLDGDVCVVEYREPAAAAGTGRMRITDVGHAYGPDRGSGDCEIDVACSPEGDGWQDAAAAVVRISVVVPAGVGWCTGALVNNVRQDCKPYILSAWHCGAESTTAQFGLYKFYFRFQYPGCGSGVPPTNMTITGAQLRGFSNDNAGNAGSDFMLLEATAPVPAAFNAYWLGWDATPVNTSSDDGVCIHHPMAAPKKVSSYTNTLTTGHWASSTGLMSHWRLHWAATQNGYGVTEHGSSGSPLLKRDANGVPLVIGTLSGGSVSCDDPTVTTYYGKMSYHWTNNPNTSTQKLKYWLDPDNTGTLVLAGSYEPCAVNASITEIAAADAPAVSPNPASDVVTVRLPADAQMFTRIEVTDATGRLVHQERFTPTRDRTFAVNAWGAGLFFVRIGDADGLSRSTPILIAP